MSPRLGVLPLLGAMLLGGLGVGALRGSLNRQFISARVRHDVYALPSPEQAVVMSLGHRAALADVIYANVLVSYGLHFKEKRRFEFAGEYLDTINALDPTFAVPYRYADTLLILQPVAPRQADYMKAAEILRRGTHNLPYNQLVWNTAGQYFAYLAPPHLKDDRLKREWRLEGAKMLARACELLGSNDRIPYHCITAATLFTKAGQKEATVRFLERMLALSDDPEVRKLAQGYLAKVAGKESGDKTRRRRNALYEEFLRDVPFVPKDLYLLLGPRLDAPRCSGLPAESAVRCASSWRDWAAARRETVADVP